MRNRALLLIVVVLLFSCVQKPKPVAQAGGEARHAVAIQYVAVPTLLIHASPSETSDVITKYGFGETVSVLSHRGNWAELRMFDNSSGWVLANELMNADTAKTLVSDTPRFFKEPQAVDGGRSHGEIGLQAKVNTDGTVIEVTTTKNTTGSKTLGEKNAEALKQAQFYPITQKGQRMTFFYTHSVYY
jgi:TonB family protein